jgi:hypothetical protein
MSFWTGQTRGDPRDNWIKTCAVPRVLYLFQIDHSKFWSIESPTSDLQIIESLHSVYVPLYDIHEFLRAHT